MNFLTKTLNSLTGQLIPYNKGDFVLRIENIWDIYDGNSKNDPSILVSIFQFDKLQHGPTNYRFALNCSKKLSIIKVPGVLKIVEVIENDTSLYMITERIKPLSYSLDSNDSKILGVYNISKTLKFLNQDANSIHGKVNMNSVFVTESGEWKLGGFEILTNLGDQDRSLLLQANTIPSFSHSINPPELTSLEVLLKGKSGLKFDAFKLGLLILQVYNDNTAVTDASMSTSFMKNLPRALQAGVKKLLSDSITTRASLELFVRKGEESFFDIEMIQNFRDLQELDFKSMEEKLEVFDRISGTITHYPDGFVEFKLLPLIIQCFQFTEQQLEADSTSKLLYHILEFNKLVELTQPKFNKFVKPIIFASFTKADRSIRMILLTSLPQYIDKLDKLEINNTIFNNLVTGFNDTNLAIREETLKSIITMAPHLTDRQLNNELLRYLAKLQNDESETIRTNVVICLSKIAHLMNKNSRLNILITAFNKSIKDPFLPTRLSTLVAFGSCLEFFTPEIIASRILSSIAPSLLDKSYKIRQEASKMFKIFLEVIEKELSKLPNEPDEDEDAKDITNLGNKLQDTSLGWGNLNRFATPPIAEEDSKIKWSHNTTTAAAAAAAVPKIDDYEFQEDDNDLIDDFDDGWGEEDDEEGDNELEEVKLSARRPVVKPSVKPTLSTRTLESSSSLAMKKKPTTTTTRSGGGLKLQAKPKTSKLKLDLKLEQDDNGWGDGWD